MSAAASSTHTSTLLNWEARMARREGPALASSSLGPNSASRCAAVAAVSPRAGSLPSSLSTSSADSACHGAEAACHVRCTSTLPGVVVNPPR